MTNKRLSLVFISVGILFLAVAVFFYVAPDLMQKQTITVPASLEVSEELNLQQGNLVRVRLTLSNPVEGIGVRVLDSNQEIVYNGGVVYSSLEFTFTPNVSGSHVLAFQNSNSENSQTVEYKLTYPQFPEIIKLAANATGAVLLGIGLTRAYLTRKK